MGSRSAGSSGSFGAFDVAVIGMACAFPGAPDLARYWANVVAGTDAVTEVDPGRWSAERHWDPVGTPGEGSPSKWGGFLPPLPFDALAHGVPPASLGGIESAQLLALETASRALADAGYAERPFDREQTSVIFAAEAGADLASAYAARSVLPLHLDELPAELDRRLPRLTEDSFPGTLANVIAGRVANRLDLGGTNYTVDAACASSLAALDQSCKELLAGTSDLVLCGAVDTHNGLHDYRMFGSVRALSPTGRCRAFDAAADGIVLAEGVACLVLKRLADAEADGDRVYAVIKGVGAASDGRSRGLTAPRPEGQRRALDRAYATAGLSPREVGLLEAHGTGTVVGDRTELETLTGLFREAGAEPGGCALGSVKSLIGHAKCAAGLAGLIKAVLAVHTGVRPPTSHLNAPNPAWDPATSPFAFDPRPRPWTAPHRVAGVSAFGFGGVNYHVVLTAAAEPAALPAPAAGLLLFRGDEPQVHAALRELAERVPDEGWTTSAVTGTGPVRVAIVTDPDAGAAGLLDQLELALAGTAAPERGVHLGDGTRQSVALLFPGQGSQRPGQLTDLFLAFPRLRRFLDADPALAEALFPAFGAAEQSLVDTRLAQPALGLGALATLELLRAFGVEADLFGGHSYGELPALAAAGALPESAVPALSAARAGAMHAAGGDDPGTMAAVALPAAEVTALLDAHGLAERVVLANDNAPDQVVLAGPVPEVEAAVAALRAAGHTAKPLPVAAAFHSPRMAPAVTAFAEALDRHEVRAPERPVWSGATAAPYPGDPAEIRALLAGSLRQPVRFTEQVERMYAAGARVFLEAGPGTVLTRLTGAVLGDRPHTALSVDAPGRPGVAHLLGTLAALAVRGVPVRLDELAPQHVPPSRVPQWTVDGHLVRTADGEPVPGGSVPAGPPVSLAASGAAERDETVIEFLRGTQRIVTAQQEVMLRYLGADPAPQPTIVLQPEPEPVPRPVPTVVELVAERTGYPAAMLDPDLDLEAALGVDSLKRAEIAATLLAGTPHAAAAGDLADRRTIRSMSDWLAGREAPATAGTPAGPRRYLVDLAPEPRDVPAPVSGRVAISGGGEVAAELAALLKERGAELVDEEDAPDSLVLLDALDGPAGPVLPGRFGDLRAAVLGGVRTLLLATRHEQGPAGAGLHGFARTLARERPELAVTAVDVPCGRSAQDTAMALAAELDAGTASVGQLDGRRALWRTTETPLPQRPVTAAGLGLTADSVLLLTGGARGITARIALALAGLTGCHVELLGRTGPAEGTGESEDALRARLIAEGAGGPAEIEHAVRAAVSARQVRECLDGLAGPAASVRHQVVDVRDQAALAAAVDRVYARHGRIDTVVHAAGVVRDGLLADKTPETFAEVFDTKVGGATTLARVLRPGLRHLVLFGSIAGVTGNAGQSDYAAANDALDTLARQWQGRLAERVLALDWGPWAAAAGGMVGPELERDYQRRGIGLIDPDEGVAALLRELAFGTEPQVLYAAGDPAAFGGGHG